MELDKRELIDLDDVDIEFSEDEERWGEFVDEIMAGHVIPVIGPDFQVNDAKNFHTQLIDLFAKKYGVASHPQTFSQLIYDKDKKFIGAVKKPEAIYTLINQVLTKVAKRPSDLLLRLLGTKKFPFVITTSFTPVVESAMRQVWEGQEVGVLQFRNDSYRDMVPGVGDVQSIKQMAEPTVFYMFGKYSAEKYRYVVTDVDMMEFCRSWLSGTNTPRVLTEAIKKSYLLVLGNNYSDWLFRFICYSLRSSAEGMRSSLMVNSHSDDDPLVQFLGRLETFLQRDPEYVVSEIERRIVERERQQQKEAKQQSKKQQQEYNTDVFLSYSRADEALVGRLYDALSQRGLRVWFDRNDIKEADNWRRAIIGGIKTTRIFVPVLTASIESEIMEAHEYRTEWKEAAAMAGKIGGRTFIVPLAEQGFDFYNELTDVPQEFSERNATWFDAATDWQQVAQVIEHKVNEVKQLEQQIGHGRQHT